MDIHLYNTTKNNDVQKTQISPSYQTKKEKRRGSNTKKEPEPLIELLYQEFPKTDPLEIERIIKRVKQWLEQKHEYFEKMSNKVAKKMGEKATDSTYNLHLEARDPFNIKVGLKEYIVKHLKI